MRILQPPDLTIAEHRILAEGAGLYSHPCRTDDGSLCCLARFIFTHAILSDLTPWGYGDRWCYHSLEAAQAALGAWDGTGEPEGWHRHPLSGRRREDGKEYVNR